MTNGGTMKRREFVRKSAAAGGVALLHGWKPRDAQAKHAGARTAARSTEVNQRNVLLIIADDHGCDQLGCYGNTNIKTPHLDSMASRGVRFTNAFAIAPSCSASRASILTGLYPHQNGQFGHEHNWHHFSLLDWVETIPSLLRKNGYRTGLIGKLHVGSKSKLDFDFRIEGKEIMGNRDALKMSRLAGDFFNESRERPFFLLVGYSDPHRDDQGPSTLRNVENFSGFANDKTYAGVRPTKYKPEDVRVPDFLPDIPEVRAELADQFEAVTRLDQSVGWILENLKKSGRDRDTLVIYISDNGIPFPGAKTTLYDSGTRVPMIVLSPEVKSGGIVNDAMVSLLDLVPTVLDWAAVSPPRYKLPGTSLRGILNTSDDSRRTEIYCSHTFHEITMFYPMRAIRTKKYKYIYNLFPELEFPFATDLFVSKTWQAILRQKLETMGKRSTRSYLYRPKEELYDLESDPAESLNLARDPTYEAALKELRERLAVMRADTDDYWLINDNYAVNRITFPDPRT